MYSVVLAAVLTTGTPSTGWGHREGDFSGSAGYTGSCCGNCECDGGCPESRHGFLGICDFFRNLFSRNNGCKDSCCDCMGCMGAPNQYGVPSNGFPPGVGQGYPMTPDMSGPAMPIALPEGPAIQPTPATQFPQLPMPGIQPPETLMPGAQPPQAPMPSTYATVVITLPADAKFFVDGIPLMLDSGTRVFRTPDLKPGVTYSYEIKITMERAGKPVEFTKNVDLEAGKTARVHFPEP